jgi:SPASM domain peptide maturase of grasp-with-spasm system
MNNNTKHFLLFANCIPVKGFNRSLICDLQRGKFIFIPNGLYELTKFFRFDTLEALLKRFEGLDEDTLSDYLEFLVEYELGFFADNPNEFPELLESFQTPYALNDCIIEISERNVFFADKIVNELQLTGCQNLELRAYDPFSVSGLFELIKKLNRTRVRNVEVYNAFDPAMDESLLLQNMADNPIVSRYFIHSSPTDKRFESDSRIIMLTDRITSSNCCGNISSHSFEVNLPFFLEAKQYNSCLYRKISIDKDGNIRNCPSLPEVFGNVETESFFDVIDSVGFKAKWNINKDQIETCKDCEFRYVCSDCRAFLSNEFDKPAKCNYNPYTNEYEKRD